MTSISTRTLGLILGVAFLASVVQVSGHGRLWWPPGRSTVFRHWQQFGSFNPTPNYNDNELNCGTFPVQFNENGGKCGVCGDNYALPSPRPNENGGIYANNIIVEHYTSGQEIDIHVQLTANHLGHFEFRLCENNNPSVPEAENCFDQHLLEVVDDDPNTVRTRVPVILDVMEYPLRLRLPAGLSCERCVLQWHYLTGNSWGECGDGTGAIGCGDIQETFRACADISIN